ncbi:MAG: hypothetical protein LBF70_00960 [Holosporales bacterium]|nr:hypothetical protein [Holosporales bacterium]
MKICLWCGRLVLALTLIWPQHLNAKLFSLVMDAGQALCTITSKTNSGGNKIADSESVIADVGFDGSGANSAVEDILNVLKVHMAKGSTVIYITHPHNDHVNLIHHVINLAVTEGCKISKIFIAPSKNSCRSLSLRGEIHNCVIESNLQIPVEVCEGTGIKTITTGKTLTALKYGVTLSKISNNLNDASAPLVIAEESDPTNFVLITGDANRRTLINSQCPPGYKRRDAKMITWPHHGSIANKEYEWLNGNQYAVVIIPSTPHVPHWLPRETALKWDKDHRTAVANLHDLPYGDRINKDIHDFPTSTNTYITCQHPINKPYVYYFG